MAGKDNFQSQNWVSRGIRRFVSNQLGSSSKAEDKTPKNHRRGNHLSRSFNSTAHKPKSEIYEAFTPLHEAPMPHYEATTPLHDVTMPFQGATMPFHGATMPTYRASKPLHGATTSFQGATTPLHGTTTPLHEAITPLHGTTMPTNGSTTPLHEATTPLHEATVPLHEATTSVHEKTMPLLEATTLLHGTTMPIYGSTTSIHEATTSIHGATTSVHEATTPHHGATTSVHETTTPVPGVAQRTSSRTPRRSIKELYLDSSLLDGIEYSQTLGHGSFGTVYACTYDEFPCAVKIFEAKAKFQKIEKEAEMVFLLTHANLIQVYGLCRKNDRECLVMESCTTSLTTYLDKQQGHQQYTANLKLSILHQIIQGMLCLHQNQIVHGDLSPGNVLLQLEGPAESSSTFIVKIADFGQSRLLNSNPKKQQTSTHGKEDFMPPEVLKAGKGKYPISKSVDLFSFGCLVPYVATCMYPNPNVQEVRNSSELKKRMRLIHLNKIEPPEFKTACEDVMTTCLQDKPESRTSFQHISVVLGPLVKRYVDQGYSATEEEKIAEIIQLTDELQSKKDLCYQLQREKDEIERTHSLLQTYNQALKTESSDNKEKITKLQADLAGLQIQVDKKSYSLKMISDLGLGNVVEDTQKLKDERGDAVRKKMQAEERNAELEDLCQVRQEQVDTLKLWLDETTTKMTNLEKEQTKLVEENHSLLAQLQRVQDDFKVSSLECTQLQQKISQLDGDVQTITASKDNFQTNSRNLTTEKNKLKDSLRSTKSELEASERKVEQHEATISDQHARLQKTTQDLLSETSYRKAAEGKISKSRTQNQNQETELGRLKTKAVQLKDKMSELRNKLSAETEAKETLQESLDSLTEAKTEADKHIEEMTHIVKYLKEEVKTKDEEYKELDSKYSEVLEGGRANVDLTEKLKNVKASHEETMAMHRTATKEKEELSRKVKELKKTKVELTDTVASKEGVIKVQQEEMESLKLSHAKSCDDSSTLESEKKRLTEDLAAAETERDALKNSEAKNETSIRNNRRTINQQADKLDSLVAEKKELEQSLQDVESERKNERAMNERAEAFLQQCKEQCLSMKEDLDKFRQMLEKARKTESQSTQDKDQAITEFGTQNILLQTECHRLEQEARYAETAVEQREAALESELQQLKQEHEHLMTTHTQCEELGKKKLNLEKRERRIQKEETNIKKSAQILRKDQMAAKYSGHTSLSNESLDHMKREVTAMKDHQELALEDMKRELKATVEMVQVKQGRIQQMDTALRHSKAAYSQLENKLESLAEHYFCAQRYPFFLHNMQVAGLPELEYKTQQFFKSDVSISDVEVLGQGFTFVKSVLDLPHAAIDDLFQAVQKATRKKMHLALSATFYHFKGKSQMITFHRFHIISVSCILVRAEWSGDVGLVQPTPLYLHASVDIDNACLLHSTPHAESLGIGGLYYLTQMQGQKEQFKQLQALSSGALVVKKETGTVHEISKYLDRKLYTHTVEKYSSLASPSVDVPKVQVKKMATR